MSFYFGQSAKMRAIESKARLIARSSAPVLIEGEPGAGKQALAHHLHLLRGLEGRLIRLNPDFPAPVHAPSNAPEQRLLVVDNLVNERGATVLLKDVGRLSTASQEWLLGTLDQIKTFPLLISTTSEPVEPLVQSGKFLPELFRRLSAYRIQLPPLRRRRRDIPELFGRMLAEMQTAGIRVPPADPGTIRGLTSYSWPGNVRELQKVARYYLVNPHSGATITEIAQRLNRAPLYAEARKPASANPQQEERLEPRPRARALAFSSGGCSTQ